MTENGQKDRQQGGSVDRRQREPDFFGAIHPGLPLPLPRVSQIGLPISSLFRRPWGTQFGSTEHGKWYEALPHYGRPQHRLLVRGLPEVSRVTRY